MAKIFTAQFNVNDKELYKLALKTTQLLGYNIELEGSQKLIIYNCF
jgi:hypothetical protein